MPKRLRWTRVDTATQLTDGRILLKVLFMDDQGGTYIWVPKWAEVQQLFKSSLELESFNVPTSAWIKEFATTAKEVFDHCSGQIADAQLIHGTLRRIEDGKLVLECDPRFYDTDTYKLPAAFELTKEWLIDYLDHRLRCLIINGIVVEADIW